jgi:hypothetical protein
MQLFSSCLTGKDKGSVLLPATGRKLIPLGDSTA